jgi:hypothetical protein
MATVVPQWLLRRLASRFIRIVKRRAPQSPVIEAFLQFAVPKAEQYIAAYDKSMKFDADWKREMAEGRGAIVVLLKQIRAWAPLVKRDVPGFDTSTYGDQPDVPDDVLEDGERLASVIQEFRDNQGNALPYQKAALDALSVALQAAAKEWAEAEAADSQHQQLLASVRELAASLQQELVALRRSLMAVAGRTDRDYLKLRVEHAGTPDEDDDPNAPPAPKPVQAAPSGNGVQTGP